MSHYEGNPFFWGFNEQRGIETLAQRGKATYNKTAETTENIPGWPHPTEDDENAQLHTHFFDQNFGTSPNPAFVTGFTEIDPMPYIAPSSEESNKTDDNDDCLEDDEESTKTDDNDDCSEDDEEVNKE